ncbi:568_t:CDS:2, partial [Rhizophagus irregularis]
MEPTKLDYSMYALNQTIHEKKELFSYQNNNSDENPKSLDYDHDESDEIDNFFKSSSEKKSSSLFLQKTDNSSKKRRKPSNERGSNGADGEKDKQSKKTNSIDLIFFLGLQLTSLHNTSDIESQNPSPLLISSQLEDFRESHKILFEYSKSLFTTEEWNEIKRAVKKFPEVNHNFADSMMRFSN